MAETAFDDFVAAVTSLWPTYRTDVGPMWDTVLRRYSMTEIGQALRKHRAERPDDSKPIWKLIYADLTDGKQQSSKSDLQILLNQQRRILAEHKVKGATNWGDWEVFQSFLDTQVYPRLYDTLTRQPRDDPDGRHAAMAARERAGLTHRYIRDLKERSEPVPEWLMN